MKKMLKLAGLAALAFTVAGCGKGANKDVLVPKGTLVAAYIDVGKAYDNGKEYVSDVIDELPDNMRKEVKKGFKEGLGKFDEIKDALTPEWAVIAFGGTLKHLSDAPDECWSMAIKIDAGEDAVTKLLKEKFFAGRSVKTDKSHGNVRYEVADGRYFGLVDDKYLIFGASKEAFDDMFDLYAGDGRESEDFDDLTRISGDTVCRIATAPVSKILERLELTRHVEKFFESSKDEELADMVLNMGPISIDVDIGEEADGVLRVECASSTDARIIEHVFNMFALATRIGAGAAAYMITQEPDKNKMALELIGGTDFVLKMLRTAKNAKVTRSGSTVETSAVSGLGIVAGAVAIPNFIKYRRDAQKAACITNMKQLESAVELYFMNAGSSRTPTMSDLCGPDKYLKTEPTCPAGGRYTIRKKYGDNDGIDIICPHADDAGHRLEGSGW